MRSAGGARPCRGRVGGPGSSQRPTPGPTSMPTPRPASWGDTLPVPVSDEVVSVPRWSIGVCVAGWAGALVGVGGAICVAIDKHGLGVLAAGGTSEGPQFGASGGGGLMISSGDVTDQAGKFKYT